LTIHKFSAAYRIAFHEHVLRSEEHTLRVAYELGREALRSGVSLLELTQVHHEVLRSEICLGQMASERVVRAAGEFFLESVAAFEMARRGFEEANHIALREKTHVRMLQQLSNFLADTSLASDGSESIEEILQLIVEQARELIGARLCVITFTGYGKSLRASSYSRDDADGDGDLEGAHLATVTSFPASDHRVAAAVESLDGKVLGFIELFDGEEREFTVVDRATLTHVAQIASSAIERVRLHSTRKAKT
jgi:hypothetical protein